MLTAFAWLSLAQITNGIPAVPVPIALPPEINPVQESIHSPNDILLYHEVRPLPGQLDQVPVFNSNSPELIQRDGILLSTLQPNGMSKPEAHLNFAFEGRFDLFAHHVVRGFDADDRRTLFLGVVVYNPSTQPIRLDILQGVSYLSQEAPFNNLPAYVANPNGQVFAGPGSRTVTDILQGKRQDQWPEQVMIPPQQAYLLINAPIPLRRLSVPVDATLPPGSVLPAAATSRGVVASSAQIPAARNRDALPSNGRSVLMYLSSGGPVHVASLAMYAPRMGNGDERAPTLREWLTLLVNGDLAGPRDISPSNPRGFQGDRFYYGRVAGVSRGSQWSALVTDGGESTNLTIPSLGQAYSYVLSTVDRNTFGTAQIQSAPMLARYADTAFRAHGNYGVRYNISLPFYNPTNTNQTISLRLQTPLQDENLKDGLRFRRGLDDRIFFRGTVRVRYSTGLGALRSRYVHVVQRRGQEGEPLIQLNLPPQSQRRVEVDFIYPPDATPPQVLTITNEGRVEEVEANAAP